MADNFSSDDESVYSSMNYEDELNEIEMELSRLQLVPYFAPSTLRALEYQSVLSSVTSALDMIFMRNFIAHLNTNMDSMKTSTPLKSNRLTEPIEQDSDSSSICLAASIIMQATPQVTASMDKDDRLTVESESLASNQQRKNEGVSEIHKESPSENTGSIGSVLRCLCQISGGMARLNLPPNPGNNPDLSQFKISDLLKSHEKYLTSCYPEISHFSGVPLTPEVLPKVDPNLYLKYILEKLNTHTYPYNAIRCGKIDNLATSSAQRARVLAKHREKERFPSIYQFAPSADSINQKSTVDNFSETGPSGAPKNNIAESSRIPNPDNASSDFSPNPPESVHSKSSQSSSTDSEPPKKMPKFR